MAIVIPKLKLKVVESQPQSELSEIAMLADEIGEARPAFEKLQTKIAELSGQGKPYLEKLAKLAGLIDKLELEDDGTTVEKGEGFQAEISKRGSQRLITSMEMVKTLMGQELFMKLATVRLKDIDDYLTAPQREQVIKTDRTKRTVKIEKRT